VSELVLPGFEPTVRQLDAARACLDPAARVVVLDGAIRSGKTQAAARILLEWAVEQPATYLVARSTYRSLKDSTEKALLFGDGGLPPLIPPELVAQYRASDEVVRLRGGAEILFRSLEEGQVSKILNLSLAGVLVDQIEELDPGEAGERVFDTLLGRLSDRRGPRKLLCVANPAGLVSWQYRRLIDEATRDRGVARVHFRLADNAQNLPVDYLEAMEATRRTRPHWYASFVEGRWGAFEGQAFEEFSDQVHVVERSRSRPAGSGSSRWTTSRTTRPPGCCGWSTTTATWSSATSTTRRVWSRSMRRRSSAAATSGGSRAGG
jgi:phage terminase large subunit